MKAGAIRNLSLILTSLPLGGCLASTEASERNSEAIAPPATPQPPKWGWDCVGTFEVEGQRVGIGRGFDDSGTINPYSIQSFDHEPHGTTWTIDPRPDGPPVDAPPSWNRGRSEAKVLREGPDYVHISYPWHTEVVGPVYVYFWGDGTYIGAEQLFSARQVRRWTGKDGKMGGLSSGLSKGPIMQALYKTQDWTFKVTDATGKELTSGTFHPPDLARSIVEYRRVRAEIEKLEVEFRTDFQTKTLGTTRCAANDDPASSI